MSLSGACIFTQAHQIKRQDRQTLQTQRCEDIALEEKTDLVAAQEMQRTESELFVSFVKPKRRA